MWLMLQAKEPKDYVIATGKSHSVQELIELAFKFGGLDSSQYVKVDAGLLRPADVGFLCGDASLARKELGWTPTVSFEQLIKDMVEEDLRRNRENPRALSAVGHF